MGVSLGREPATVKRSYRTKSEFSQIFVVVAAVSLTRGCLQKLQHPQDEFPRRICQGSFEGHIESLLYWHRGIYGVMGHRRKSSESKEPDNQTHPKVRPLNWTHKTFECSYIRFNQLYAALSRL